MPGGDYSVACPNYFRTMGIPILEGREFTPQDTLGAPGAVVINEAMAHAFWPRENPVGRAIRLGGINGPRLTIVGVVGNVHQAGLDIPVRPATRPSLHAGWLATDVNCGSYRQHACQFHGPHQESSCRRSS